MIAMKKTLICWLGTNDLRCSRDEESGLGPIGQAVAKILEGAPKPLVFHLSPGTSAMAARFPQGLSTHQHGNEAQALEARERLLYGLFPTISGPCDTGLFVGGGQTADR